MTLKSKEMEALNFQEMRAALEKKLPYCVSPTTTGAVKSLVGQTEATLFPHDSILDRSDSKPVLNVPEGI